ncbi:unnamed protein product [Ambrosiozyma monospora]|uniref:Unnamed protein product n=1 Tax=Ambrosiozyma monospora TaxID=43982 RepID=A0A9W6YU77_AMBMO|nr:unnamed protein product [Ambrosiozyma monospora]
MVQQNIITRGRSSTSLKEDGQGKKKTTVKMFTAGRARNTSYKNLAKLNKIRSNEPTAITAEGERPKVMRSKSSGDVFRIKSGTKLSTLAAHNRTTSLTNLTRHAKTLNARASRVHMELKAADSDHSNDSSESEEEVDSFDDNANVVEIQPVPQHQDIQHNQDTLHQHPGSSNLIPKSAVSNASKIPEYNLNSTMEDHFKTQHEQQVYTLKNPELSHQQLQHQGQIQQQLDGMPSANVIPQHQEPLQQEMQNNEQQHLLQETHSQQVQQHIDKQGQQDLQSQIQQQQMQQRQEIQDQQRQQLQMQQLEQQQLQFQQAALPRGEEPKHQLYNAPTFLLSQSTGQERPLFHNVPSHINNSVKYSDGEAKFFENDETQSTSTVAPSMSKTDSGTSLIFQQSAVNLRNLSGMVNPSRPSIGIAQQVFKRTEPYNNSSASKGSILSALTPLVSAASSSRNNNSNRNNSNVSKSELNKTDDLSNFLIPPHTNSESRMQQKMWLQKENLNTSVNTQENPFACSAGENQLLLREYVNVRRYNDPILASIHRVRELRPELQNKKIRTKRAQSRSSLAEEVLAGSYSSLKSAAISASANHHRSKSVNVTHNASSDLDNDSFVAAFQSNSSEYDAIVNKMWKDTCEKFIPQSSSSSKTRSSSMNLNSNMTMNMNMNMNMPNAVASNARHGRNVSDNYNNAQIGVNSNTPTPRLSAVGPNGDVTNEEIASQQQQQRQPPIVAPHAASTSSHHMKFQQHRMQYQPTTRAQQQQYTVSNVTGRTSRNNNGGSAVNLVNFQN